MDLTNSKMDLTNSYKSYIVNIPKIHVFYLLLIIAIFYLNADIQLFENSFSTSYSIKPKFKPIIIQWNEYAWKNISYIDYECGKKCIFTKDQKLEEYATIITFHVGSMQLWDYPKSQNEERMHVFVNFEPPTNAPILVKLPEDFFNYTVTYRWDSDIAMPYGCFLPLGKNDSDRYSQEEVDTIVSQKTKEVVSLISHCNTSSKREKVIENLHQYINVTNYGSCFHSSYNPDPDTSKYHFVIAFENAHCIDYVTEKVWRLRDLAVPIIMDRAILRGKHAALNPYVIAVSDFKSIKDLATYLKFLTVNPAQYRKYFEWTKLYKKSYGCFFLTDFPCLLCDLALKISNGYRKQNNVRKWWQEESCIPDYGEKMFSNEIIAK